jgi:hypothetical protein
LKPISSLKLTKKKKSKKLLKKKNSFNMNPSESEKSEEDFSIKKSKLDKELTDPNLIAIILKDFPTYISLALFLSGGKHYFLLVTMSGHLIWLCGFLKWLLSASSV